MWRRRRSIRLRHLSSSLRILLLLLLPFVFSRTFIIPTLFFIVTIVRTVIIIRTTMAAAPGPTASRAASTPS